jgi:hypothetical protein
VVELRQCIEGRGDHWSTCHVLEVGGETTRWGTWGGGGAQPT